jgi:CheY-like chemotaxis protein
MAKILIVEDDESLGAAITNIAESCGHDAVWAENGRSAIEKLKSDKFDCVVSDVQMPVMNGLELLTWTRANHPIPFIVMTGFAEQVDTKNIIKNGAINLLMKPFRKKEFEQALQLALSDRGGKDSSPPNDFFLIPKGTVLQPGQMEINLYKTISGNFVKVASRGEIYDSSKTGPTFHQTDLFTEKSNIAVLIPLNLIVTKALMENGETEPEKKIEFLRRTGQLLAAKIFFDGIDETLLKQIQDYLEGVSNKGFAQSAARDIDVVAELKQAILGYRATGAKNG